MGSKERLDIVLVNKGLARSREIAKSVIMSGKVLVDGQVCDKAGTGVSPGSIIEVKEPKLKYVSRGGLKLEKALQEFALNLNGKTCLDIGASTGGFTDVMLQNGAKKIFAVDVGYGQFDWTLRNDPRVVVLEKTNARYLTQEQIRELCDFATADVSFISLGLILKPIATLLNEKGRAVCLIKPQFEAGRDKVGKKGVVKDFAVHLEVIEKVAAIAPDFGLYPENLTYSPIKGPQGNIEYLMLFSKKQTSSISIEALSLQTVEAARQQLS